MTIPATRLAVTIGLATLGALGCAWQPGVAEAGPATVVVGRSGADLRWAPTTHSTSERVLPPGARVRATCWVMGGAEGSRPEQRWYKYDSEGNPSYWLPAGELRPVSGRLARCAAPSVRARTTTRLRARTGPSLLDAAWGVVPADVPVTVVCRAEGEPVGGNRVWYLTDRGEWLSSRYLRTAGATPQWCTRAH